MGMLDRSGGYPSDVPETIHLLHTYIILLSLFGHGDWQYESCGHRYRWQQIDNGAQLLTNIPGPLCHSVG